MEAYPPIPFVGAICWMAARGFGGSHEAISRGRSGWSIVPVAAFRAQWRECGGQRHSNLARSRIVGAGGQPSLGTPLRTTLASMECLLEPFVLAVYAWKGWDVAPQVSARLALAVWPGVREAVAHLAGRAEVHLSEEAVGPGEAVKVAYPGQVLGLARAERSAEGAAKATQMAQMPSGVASVVLRGLCIDPAAVMTIRTSVRRSSRLTEGARRSPAQREGRAVRTTLGLSEESKPSVIDGIAAHASVVRAMQLEHDMGDACASGQRCGMLAVKPLEDGGPGEHSLRTTITSQCSDRSRLRSTRATETRATIVRTWKSGLPSARSRGDARHSAKNRGVILGASGPPNECGGAYTGRR